MLGDTCSVVRKNLPYRGRLPIERKIGSGPECVYVYYEKAIFELAQLKKKTTWLCKIGCTVGEPDIRVITQRVKTAHSEVPIIPLTLHTDDSRNLERLLHAALAYAGRHEKGSLGREWFQT